MGGLITLIKDHCVDKQLTLQHVWSHQGEPGNELADVQAKQANASLPTTPPAEPRQPWDILFRGELVGPPHKTWVRQLAPHHQHEGIHRVSWRVIRRRGWFRWLLGLQHGMGYQHTKSFWWNTRGPTSCSTCEEKHNQSIHGHIGLCLR